MTTLYYLPIEPLQERYTEQWYRQFPIEFSKHGFDVEVIDGIPLSSFVGVGTFLDMNSTVFYKAEQLKQVALMFHEKKVKNGDVFFVGDLEFWGIESIRYMAHLQNIQVRIYGFLHAASYTKEDYMEPATPYAKYFELGWLKICDEVFVGSGYHRNAVYERRILPYAAAEDRENLLEKIHVTGNPLFLEEYHNFDGGAFDPSCMEDPIKENRLVISNRFDWEKRPNMSLNFAQLLKDRNPNLEIIVCTSRPKFTSNKKWLSDYALLLERQGVISIQENLSKEEYHYLLHTSKVMLTNSIEENFGYCVAEALWYGCAPVCPNSCSHPELVQFDNRLLFNSEDEIIEKVEALIKKPIPREECREKIERYENSVAEMAHIMKGDHKRHLDDGIIPSWGRTYPV